MARAFGAGVQNDKKGKQSPPAEDGKEEPSTKKKMGGESRDHMWVAQESAHCTALPGHRHTGTSVKQH